MKWFNIMKHYIVSAVDNALSSRVSPLVFLFIIESLWHGVSHAVFYMKPDVNSLSAYIYGSVILPPPLWGWVVILLCLAALYGVATLHRAWVMIPSFISACMWFALIISYALHGYTHHLMVIAAMHMLAFLYLYYATAMNRLWDYTPMLQSGTSSASAAVGGLTIEHKHGTIDVDELVKSIQTNVTNAARKNYKSH